MRRLWNVLAVSLLVLGALGASAQGIVGLNPTPLGLYEWNSTTNQAQPVTNAYSSFALSSAPQPILLYGWNASLGQWVPCSTGQPCLTSSGLTQLIAGQGININPPSGVGAVTVACDTSTTSQIGCSKPDGTTITVSNGVLSAVPAAAGVTSLNALTGAVNIAGDSTISVTPSGQNIDLHATGATGLVIPPVTGSIPAAPVYGAVDSSGVAWMPLEGRNTIAKITQTGTYTLVSVTGATFGTSSQGAFDSSGNFWVNSGTTVYEISPAGTVTSSFPAGGGRSTTGLTIDHAGNIWVSTENVSGDVLVYSTAGALLHTITAGYAMSLFTAPSGYIWATDYLTGRVFRISPTTFATVNTLNVGLGGTLYMAFDSSGNGWVTGAAAAITEVAANGSGILATYILPSELSGGVTGERTWGIAIDQNNRIWVTGTAAGNSPTYVAVMTEQGYTVGVFYLCQHGQGYGVLYGDSHVWVGSLANTIGSYYSVFNDTMNVISGGYPGTTYLANGDIEIPSQFTATSSNNAKSYYMKWDGSFYNTTAQTDQWVVANILGTGSSPTSTLTFYHAFGSTGATAVQFPNLIDTGAAPGSGGPNCLQIAVGGSLTNTGLPCGAALNNGVATLAAGTVTVSTTGACAVGASCNYQLTHCVAGGTLGTLSVGTVTAGTSFVINSSSSTDTSQVCWRIN